MINKETGNKKFLKTIETLFSENVSHKEKANLVKNDTILVTTRAVEMPAT